MAVANPPTYLSGTETDYPPESDRRLIGALLAPNGKESIVTRNGTKPGTMQCSGSGNSLSIDVAPGSVIIQSEDPTGGVYTCHNLSPTRVTAPAADGALPRRDYLVARVYDQPGRREWALEVVPGTPAAAPALPALPPNSTPLVWYQLAAGTTRITTSMLNDVHSEYVALGGIMPVRPGGSRPSDPYSGQPIYRMDSREVEVWAGTTWRALSYVPDRSIDVAQSDYYVLGEGTDLTAPRTDRLATRAFPVTGSSRVFVDGGITVSSINGGSRGQLIVRIDGFYAGRAYWRARTAGDVVVGLHGRAPVLAAGNHSVTVESVMEAGRAQMWFLNWDISLEPVT